MTDRHEALVRELSRDLPREIAPGVTWLGACLEFQVGDTVIHGHTSCYLVKGTESAVLVDTGNPSSWSAIEAVIDDVLDGRPLDLVFATHPELPHTGNLPRLIAKYPDIRVIGDTRDYHLFYPECTPHLAPAEPGDRFELGDGGELLVVEALIRDLPNTQWAYATDPKVLFTADGFCYMHRPDLDDEDPMHLPGECGLTTGELSEPPTAENAAFFSGSALYWSRFVDDAEVRYERVTDLVRALGATAIAPTHGNVITDLPEVMAIVAKGHKQSYRYAAPTSGPASTPSAPIDSTGGHQRALQGRSVSP